MLQKIITAFILATVSLGAYAQTVPETAELPVEDFTHQQYVDSLSAPSQQAEVVGDWVNSTEVNSVQESELTRKMMQAQKAKDAETYDKFGGGITIIAMCIVISALVVLSILFLIFGKISSGFFKKKKKQVVSVMAPEKSDDSHSIDSGEVYAAIAAALAQHFSGEHDVEDTILTIRRMRKAYSPWNSKIYNLRELPHVEHTHSKMGDR